MKSLYTPIQLRPFLAGKNHNILIPKKKACYNPSTNILSTRKIVMCAGGTESASNENDSNRQTIETAFKLFDAFKTGSLDVLPELIGNELKKSNDFQNLAPIFALLDGKKKMAELISYILAVAAKHVEIVIRPESRHEGPEVGIKWNLEWRGLNIPLGEEYNIQVNHAYQGKMFLRHGKDIIDPMVYLEPLKMKLLATFESLVDKIAPHLQGKDKTFLIYHLLSLLFFVATLILLKKASV